ncbi:MAG: AarF/ABC1/UbiB kinase family protein [Actinomycetia bacterium]|nr:AarF/ABC1/UbiB kinase family protein [Actinomycetes bacterium]
MAVRGRTRLLLLVGVAAAVAALAAEEALRANELRRSRAARNRQMVGLGARLGSAWARHRARRLFASAERRQELDLEFQLATAEQVTESLGHMKGAMMKIGQMASYLDTGLPEPVRSALSQLQQDAPPMAPALVDEMILGELGMRPADLFDQWDPVPLASASIGQVHRAVTREGQGVAVKVQYPGVAEAIAADLGNADLIFGALASMFPGLDTEAVIVELRERLIEELDYSIEAENQRGFAARFRGHPVIHVPEVIDVYCTGRVLTTELVVGTRFEEVVAEWSAVERNLAAETIYRFVFGSIYRLQAFNGDPHPGNYLFHGGGRVSFLDFGLVKRFTDAETEQFGRLIETMVLEPDPSAFRTVIEGLGLLDPGLDATDAQVVSYFRHFYEFVLQKGITTISPEYAAEGVKKIFDTSGPHAQIQRAANVPPSFVVLQRINLGLISLLAELGATADWRAIAEELWPFVDRGPMSDIGRRIERWRLDTGLVPEPQGL